jgi:hypothetical protein
MEDKKMTTFFEWPGGVPRYYIENGCILEHSSGRLAFYLRDNTVQDCDGKATFWIEDRYLHGYASQPSPLYFGEAVEGETQ